jgi:RNA recognition motif-containing protein
MGTRLFVGNLPWKATDEELNNLFAAHGTVKSCRILQDRETGRSRGFGFVEMDTQDEADAAIAALNDTEFDGRKMNVSIARERTQQPRA